MISKRRLIIVATSTSERPLPLNRRLSWRELGGLSQPAVLSKVHRVFVPGLQHGDRDDLDELKPDTAHHVLAPGLQYGEMMR